MDRYAAEELQELLERYPQFKHLKLRKYGDSLILYSGEEKNRLNHARLTELGHGQWGLSFPHHSGRWDKTPFTGSMEELLSMLVQDFPYYLQTD